MADGGGWAVQPDDGQHVHGPFTADMVPPGGVFLSDMPAAKPVSPRPRVRGVPGASNEAGEDYQPGGGTWHSA